MSTKNITKREKIEDVDSRSVQEMASFASTASVESTPVAVVKNSLYEKITLWIISCAILLLPLFVFPVFNIPFYYSKFGLMTVAVLVSAIVLILQVLNEKQVERYSVWIYALSFALPVSYVVSALFSSPRGMSLMGNGADIDTAYFYFLGATLMYLVSRVLRSKHSVFLLTLCFMSISLIVSLFHTIRFIFGSKILSLGMFNSITSNTIGGFNELSIYAGLSVLLFIVALELATIPKYIRALMYVGLVLSLSVLIVTNFNVQNNIFGLGIHISTSALVAFFALIVFIHKKVVGLKNKLPFASLFVLLITLVCTIATTPISGYVLPKVGVAQEDVLDVRVAPLASLQIAYDTYNDGVKDALLGVGPNKFYIAWGKHKPVDIQNSVNTTQFWNVDFNSASSLISTSFVTAGILGLIAWLFFLGMILYFVIQLLKKVAQPEKDSASVFVAWVVSFGTLYLWIVSALFTAGSTLVFLAFAFTGLFLATLVRENIVSTKIVHWDITTYWKGFTVTFAMVILIAVCMYIGYVWQQRVYAAVQMQAAIQTVQSDAAKITEAEERALKAINTYFNTSDLRLVSEIALLRPLKLIEQSQGVVSPEDITQEIANDISLSINSARRAAIDRGASPDYRDWLQLGKTYEAATFLGATSTAILAAESYLQAEKLNPTSPLAPYLSGRLYSFAREFDAAEVKLKRAIELKPNYTEAISVLNTVMESTKGSKSTTTSATQTTAPKR